MSGKKLYVHPIDREYGSPLSSEAPSPQSEAKPSAGNLPPDEPNYKALYTELKGERDRLLTALTKVNGIRNSIIGVQGFNWSEHAYPLVAALEEAGFAGMEYPEARANVGTLIEQIKAAEQALSELKGEVLEKVGPCAEIAHRLREHRQLMWSGDVKPGVPKCQLVPLDLLNDAIRALSSLHEKLSSIGGSSSTESAASLADGKLTAGEAQRKSEWRTIDSAPRDGTPVMVFPDHRFGGHGFTVAKYGSGHFGGMPGEVRHLTGWISEGFFMGPQPTHWMPLPPPPNPSARGEL